MLLPFIVSWKATRPPLGLPCSRTSAVAFLTVRDRGSPDLVRMCNTRLMKDFVDPLLNRALMAEMHAITSKVLE